MRRGRLSRRTILRSSIVGAAGFTVPWLVTPRTSRALAKGTGPHPNIDPLRAVGVHDPGMIDGKKEPSTWDQQEKMIKRGRVEENMDRMACALTGEDEPARAWRAIFLKPPDKNWHETVVAVKCNQIAEHHGHSAVVGRLCHVLTDIHGVRADNIHLYDACHGDNMPQETPYAGLPDGVRLESRWGGFNVRIPVPPPYKNGEGRLKCLDPLARGKVDILINLGICKGTLFQFGSFSQASKNHFGTFNPKPSHRDDVGGDYLVSVNKAPAIIGEVSDKTGEVTFPRQQLCVIDALWSSEDGPMGLPARQTARLYMGSFAPPLDYQVARQFRRDTMGWRINEELTDRLLSDYGFTPSDLPGDGTIIDAREATS